MICSWLLHPGSRWMPNVIIRSEIGSHFGTPPADWVHGYLYFEPGVWIWTKGFRRHLHIVKNWSGNFSLNSPRLRAFGWPLLGNFSGFFWGGSVGQIIYREYIVFRGSNITCSLACNECWDRDRIWTKGFRRYLHIVKNWSGNFSLNSPRVRAVSYTHLTLPTRRTV